MIDLSSIKENYSNMLDNQLVNIAIQDGHNLQPEAFNILKNEFKRRNLDYSYIESIEQRKVEIHQEEIQKIKESSDDKYNETLWNYVLIGKENSTSEKQILDGLVERGLEEDRAKEMLSQTSEKAAQLVKHYDTQMAIGGLSFFVGLFVTLLTYSQAKISGGIYIIAWGAILFGALRFFKAIPQKNRYKALSNKLSLDIK
jgi:hypothetical protein